MLKIKLIAIISILSVVAFVIQNSHSFSSSAKSDVFEEIAKYKTWTRINKEPIKVADPIQIDGEGGKENVFIIDGQEVTNFRTGVLSG